MGKPVLWFTAEEVTSPVDPAPALVSLSAYRAVVKPDSVVIEFVNDGAMELAIDFLESESLSRLS